MTERYWSVFNSQKMTFEMKRDSEPALPQMYIPLTSRQNFRISLLNKNSEVTVNLQLAAFTRNSKSIGTLRVCAIVSLPQVFCLMNGCN